MYRLTGNQFSCFSFSQSPSCWKSVMAHWDIRIRETSSVLAQPLLVLHWHCLCTYKILQKLYDLTRPGWTISWLPIRRHWTRIKLWKISWEKKRVECVSNVYLGFTMWLLIMKFLFCSHPLFHEVICMTGHLFHYSKGSWMDTNL